MSDATLFEPARAVNPSETQTEEWRPIAETGGRYEVSNLGRVRSLFAKYGRRSSPKMIALCRTDRGYLQAHLQINCKGCARLISRLVLEAFVGPCPSGQEAAHESGDRSDNRVTNLRWDTRKGNAADRKRHGTELCGEKSRNAKFTTEQVLAIFEEYGRGGTSMALLAERYGVYKTTISRIIRGKAWSHLGKRVAPRKASDRFAVRRSHVRKLPNGQTTIVHSSKLRNL